MKDRHTLVKLLRETFGGRGERNDEDTPDVQLSERAQKRLHARIKGIISHYSSNSHQDMTGKH